MKGDEFSFGCKNSEWWQGFLVVKTLFEKNISNNIQD